MCDVNQLPSPALYLLQPDQDLEGLLTQKHGVIVMKVKVEDLEGLLTQKHGMIVMKVKDLLTQKHGMTVMKVIFFQAFP